MKHRARTIGYLLTAPFAFVGCAAASAQSSSPELTIGTVRTISAAEQEQQFSLQLDAGQGVIVDLIPLQAVDATDQAADATDDLVEPADDAPIDEYADLPSPPSMRMLDPARVCVRAVPDRSNCLLAGAAANIEYQAGDGGARLAVRPVSAGRYTLALTVPPGGPASRYELLVRERDLPKPIVPVRIALCLERPVVRQMIKGQAGPPAEDPCARQYTMDRTGRAYFEFATTEPDRWVLIDMASEVLDTLVQLSGPLGNAAVEDAPVIASNDDSGGTLNSQIRLRLPQPGRYVVMGSGLFQGPGVFTLAVRELPPPSPRPVRMLQLGTPLTDTFSEMELLPYHEYAVEAEAGASIVVEMTSPSLDSRLEAGIATKVFDAASQPADSFASLAVGDDSCGTRDARILLRFEEKRLVTIQASSLGGAGGEYTIVARPAAASSCLEQEGEFRPAARY